MELQERGRYEMTCIYMHLCGHVYEFTKVQPVQLTSFIVSDTKVCRGQVDVHIMLEDLLKETLPLSQFELLGDVHIWEPLAALSLRWQSQTEEPGVRYQLK